MHRKESKTDFTLRFNEKSKNTPKTDSKFRFSTLGDGFHNPFQLKSKNKNETECEFCFSFLGNGFHNPFR